MADTPQAVPKPMQPKDDFVVPVRTGSGAIELRSASGAPVRPAKVRPDSQKLADKALELAAREEWEEGERRRFREFAVAFINDVRDRLETREALAAPAQLGGLGADRATADWMVALIAAVRDAKPIPSRPAAQIPVQTPTGIPLTPGPTPPARGGAKPLAPAAPPAPAAKPQRHEDIFAGLAKEIVDEVRPALPDPSLRPRLEALLVTRFRDIRDAIEVKTHMQRAAAQGGVGLAPAEADRLSTVLEDRFSKIGKELHTQEKDKVVADIKQKGAVQEQKRQDEAQIRQYASDVWYDERFVKKTPPAAPAPSKKPAAPTPAPTPATPVIGRSQTPSPPPASARPAPSAPRPSTPPPTPRPSVQDMAYTPAPTPKLTGPIEELESMTLADFRRLARVPKEAAEKVRAKIRLLEEEDYAQRTRAIAAWRGSEPMRKYLSVTRAMLAQGMDRDQALAAQGTGADALTADEYNAIMELQDSLRY